MNLIATLCQKQLPAFFTFYKQNNKKNVKKRMTAFYRASLLNSFCLKLLICFALEHYICKTKTKTNEKCPRKVLNTQLSSDTLAFS